MIKHFFIKDYLSFVEEQLYFEKGLVVFTGPSGSGKSILINALMATLGQGEAQAGMAEVEFDFGMDLEAYGIDIEEYTQFKQLKKGNTRFFINNQTISKKLLAQISAQYVKYLSHKDFSDFDKNALLAIVDAKVVMQNSAHAKHLEAFKAHFDAFQSIKKELEVLESEENRLEELREFARFEVEKISNIAPQVGEDEELERIKKQLSKKEKIEEAVHAASHIFELEHAVSHALSLLEKEGTLFDEAMNELKAHFEEANSMMEELEELDIEHILDRIEAIGGLKRRYGSIEEALEYKAQKEQELENYEHFDEKKASLKKQKRELEQLLTEEADHIHVARVGVMAELNRVFSQYAKDLYLNEVSLTLGFDTMDKSGVDRVEVVLGGVGLERVSSGEFNRLRLALLALKSDVLTHNGGILVLDEIDANLSGEESMSVAKVLTKLAKNYQIFAISHQPQLTSQAKQHFLVYKEDGISRAKVLQSDERINEIARMVSGDSITQEAIQFAQKLLAS